MAGDALITAGDALMAAVDASGGEQGITTRLLFFIQCAAESPPVRGLRGPLITDRTTPRRKDI